ncbi:uncharacterized protein LOC112557220 isoform X2 [Pomacea canaliculata]|uniref:uncharacterized protein LOC112557220 isoform X2 n=1 Tax=Pomacea canaliculata TaxID=400727 RepID=UPI000D73558B|nr:uncharacterized protein LOC112557220 isoform X2 [Pomacea canaliculata]
MSLFTDPEISIPAPYPYSYNPPASDSDSTDSEEEVPRARCCPKPRTVTTMKCCTTMAALLLLTLTLIAYATNRDLTLSVAGALSRPFPAAPPTEGSFGLLGEQIDSAIALSSNPDKESTEDKNRLQEAVADSKTMDADFKGQTKISLVHYVWCGLRLFDFRNYLAIRSALQAVRPEKVVVHYDYLPMQDPESYYTWLDLLQEQYPNVMLLKVDKTSQRECRASGPTRFLLILDILQRYGGMYLPDDAIFLRIPQRHLEKDFVSGVASCSLTYFAEGAIVVTVQNVSLPQKDKQLLRRISQCQAKEDDLRPCITDARFLELPSSQPSCVRLHSVTFPKDIWYSYDRLSNLSKNVAYGTSYVMPRRSPYADDRTPRIAHYLCTDDCRLSFSVYLSVLSALHVGELDRAVIHGPVQPSGPWWQRLQQDVGSRVLYLNREFPLSRDPSLEMTNQMRRYIMRTEILVHYGGIFSDGHVFWTQRLPDELLEYEAVASPDWHAHGSWPESINHALLVARGGALYLQRLLDVYYDNSNTQSPWFPDHYLSYRLLEVDPTLLYLYPRLQVKCLNHNCHPVWEEGYRSTFLQNRPGQQFDWQKDTLTVYWLDSFPDLEVDQVRFSTGLIVDIARFILRAANVGIDFL